VSGDPLSTDAGREFPSRHRISAVGWMHNETGSEKREAGSEKRKRGISRFPLLASRFPCVIGT
jgi:hypothetical protein